MTINLIGGAGRLAAAAVAVVSLAQAAAADTC